MRFDPNNCGGCNVTCPYGVPCSDGNCTVEVVSLPCTNTINDPNNCGRCGNVCEAPANASATCGNGVCGFVCNPGSRLCNGVCIPAGNCCTAAECPAGPPSATVICNSGQCGFICPAPAADAGSGIVTSAGNLALADAARPPSADGDLLLVSGGISCCITTDCIGINGTIIFPVVRDATQTSGEAFFCRNSEQCVCLNGSCFARPT
jgi:hypothetical protein